MNYRDYYQGQDNRDPMRGTPWAAVIVAIIVLGVLWFATQENRTGQRSGVLDKADECCRVITGDKSSNSMGERQ